MRHQRGDQERRHEHPRAPRTAAAQPGRLPLGTTPERRPVATREHRRGRPQREEREDDEDDADHVAVGVVHAHRRDAQVRLRRQQLGVVQHQRRAEVVDHADEGEQRAGAESRQRKRERHPPQETQAMTPERLRRFFGGRVHTGQRGGGVDEDEREVVERLHEDDAREPFHERDGGAERVEQEEVDHAAAPEDLLERHRPHERRHDERQERQGLREAAAGEVVAREEQRERERDHAAAHDRDGARDERVGQSLHEQPAPEERGEVREREPVRRRHGHDEDPRERIGDEDDEERQDAGEERGLAGPGDHAHVRAGPRELRRCRGSSSGGRDSTAASRGSPPPASDCDPCGPAPRGSARA